MSNWKKETQKHVNEVRYKLREVVSDLCKRSANHDSSKFSAEESVLFAEFTPKL